MTEFTVFKTVLIRISIPKNVFNFFVSLLFGIIFFKAGFMSFHGFYT